MIPNTNNVTVAKIAAALQMALNDTRTNTAEGKAKAFEVAYRVISKVVAETDGEQGNQDQTSPG